MKSNFLDCFIVLLCILQMFLVSCKIQNKHCIICAQGDENFNSMKVKTYNI